MNTLEAPWKYKIVIDSQKNSVGNEGKRYQRTLLG